MQEQFTFKGRLHVETLKETYHPEKRSGAACGVGHGISMHSMAETSTSEAIHSNPVQLLEQRKNYSYQSNREEETGGRSTSTFPSAYSPSMASRRQDIPAPLPAAAAASPAAEDGSAEAEVTDPEAVAEPYPGADIEAVVLPEYEAANEVRSGAAFQSEVSGSPLSMAGL